MTLNLGNPLPIDSSLGWFFFKRVWTMEKGIRVMYLHTLRGSPNGDRSKVLEEACKPYRLLVPNLKTREALTLFSLCFGTYLIFITVFLIACLYTFSYIMSLIIIMGTFIGIWLMYILAGRSVTVYMVLRATGIAEEAFQTFRPNVIVASSFGAVIVFGMQVPKVSLILLAPGQDAYCRYLKKKKLPTLKGFPHVTIVHGSQDDQVRLEDSIRLIDSSTQVQCKLEVIEDDHSLKSLTAEDYREFIEEAYTKGREYIFKVMKHFKNASLPLPQGEEIPFADLDPNLFLIDTNKSFHRDQEESSDKLVNKPLVDPLESFAVPLNDEEVKALKAHDEQK